MHGKAVFTDKAYDRLHNLWKRWGISQEDAYYAIENGLLRACVWLPMRYVERGVVKDGKFIFEQHEYKEGFLGLRPEDFRHICSTGRAKLRTFRSVKREGNIVRLAYDPPQPSVVVRLDEIVILKEDRVRFEQDYNVSASQAAQFASRPSIEFGFHYSNDYRHVTLNGVDFHLGDVQSRVIEQLHDAAQSRNPWVHGKTLLYESGSQAMRLRDIFKHKKDWRCLIAANGRGYYRLNIPLQETQNNPAVCSIEGEQDESSGKNPADDSSNHPIPARKAAPIKPVVFSIQFLLVFVAHQIARVAPFSSAINAACDCGLIA